MRKPARPVGNRGTLHRYVVVNPSQGVVVDPRGAAPAALRRWRGQHKGNRHVAAPAGQRGHLVHGQVGELAGPEPARQRQADDCRVPACLPASERVAGARGAVAGQCVHQQFCVGPLQVLSIRVGVA